MSRVRVYEAEDVARRMRETFADRPVEDRVELQHNWPSKLQQIGDSLGVAYSSDKWKNPDRYGRRPIEPYLHLAESRNRCFARKGILYDYYQPNQRYRALGPMVSFADVPMPKDFAVLALFEELRLQLYTPGETGPEIRGDEGIVQVKVSRAILGGSEIQWSKIDKGPDQPFLFVYTEAHGVRFVVVGDELAIERDGIVG